MTFARDSSRQRKAEGDRLSTGLARAHCIDGEVSPSAQYVDNLPHFLLPSGVLREKMGEGLRGTHFGEHRDKATYAGTLVVM